MKSAESELGMACSDYGKCIFRDFSCKPDLVVPDCGVEEMVVMGSNEQSAGDTLGDPLLMKHEVVVVGDAEIKQRRFAGNDQIKAVFLPCRDKGVGQLRAVLAESGGGVQTLHLADARDAGREGFRAHPVGTGPRE